MAGNVHCAQETNGNADRVAVSGSGYIAIELTGIFASLGAHATLVLRGHKALKDFDSMLGEGMVKIMRDEGIEVASNAWPQAIRHTPTGDLEVETAQRVTVSEPPHQPAARDGYLGLRG